MSEDETSGNPKPGALAPAVPRSDRPLDLRTTLLALITVILLGWALRATSVVTVPLVAAILIALALMPVRDQIRSRMPERIGWLGQAAAMALILIVLCIFFGGLWLAAQRLVSQFPTQAGQIVGVLQDTGGAVGRGTLLEGAVVGARAAAGGGSPAERAVLDGPARQDDGKGDVQERLLPDSTNRFSRMLGGQTAGAAAGVAVTILNSALTTVTGLALVFFLTLLILNESSNWREKLQTVAHGHNGWRLSESAEVIAGKIRAYLLLRAILGLVTAALYALWLWLFGVGLVLVWALLTFLLNFVPVVGSLVAGILPVAYALITQDWGTALLVGVGILIIEQVMGNYVDPKFSGSQIALSPLVVLLALLFWAWVWGIPGALLAVPVTVSLAVVGAHVPILRPWALLLTNRTTMRGLDDVTHPE